MVAMRPVFRLRGNCTWMLGCIFLHNNASKLAIVVCWLTMHREHSWLSRLPVQAVSLTAAWATNAAEDYMVVRWPLSQTLQMQAFKTPQYSELESLRIVATDVRGTMHVIGHFRLYPDTTQESSPRRKLVNIHGISKIKKKKKRNLQSEKGATTHNRTTSIIPN